MTFLNRSLVEETTTSSGTGQSITLNGKASGRRSFADAGYSAGDNVSYVLIQGNDFEGGIGTFQGGSSFDRASTPDFSTNSGNRIDLDGSEANVIAAPLGERCLVKDGNGRWHDGDGTRIAQLVPQGEKSSNFTTSPDEEYPVDVSSNAVTVTLHGSPQDGDRVRVTDVNRNASNNNITVDGNGNNIDGNSSKTIDRDGGYLDVRYDSTAGEWHTVLSSDVIAGSPVKSGTTQSITSDLSLATSDSYAQHIKADSSGLTVSLPDATGFSKNGLKFEIYNRGQTGNTFALDDGAGNPLITKLGAQESVLCHLHDNATVRGVWSLTDVQDVTAVSSEAVTAKEVDTISTINIDAAMLDADIGIAIWRDKTSNNIWARAIDYSTDPPTLKDGSALKVENVDGIPAKSKHSAVRIDSSNVLVVYRDSTNSVGKSAILNWDGSNLTVKSGPHQYTSNQSFGPVVAHLSGDQYLVVYHEFTNSTLDAVVLNTSNLTLTTDISETTISTDNGRNPAVAAFDGTYALAVWDNTTNSRADASLIKVSGGSITNPDNITGIENAGSAFNRFSCDTLNASRAVAQFADGSNDDVEAHGITFDSANETITEQSNLEYSSLGDGVLTDGDTLKIDADEFLWIFRDGSSAEKVWIIHASFDGSTVSEIAKLVDGSSDKYISTHIANGAQDVNSLGIFAEDNANSGNVTATRYDISALLVEPQ